MDYYSKLRRNVFRCFDLQSLVLYQRDVNVLFCIGQINEDEHRQLIELINSIVKKGVKCEKNRIIRGEYENL